MKRQKDINKELVERIEKLEKQIDVLKHAGTFDCNKVIMRHDSYFNWPFIKYHPDICFDYIYDGEVKTINWREVKSLGELKVKLEVKQTNGYEAILKFDDEWLKLDKVKGVLINIPEPAEFAEKKSTDISEESKDE